ncbi:hypothetical protein ANCDUO_16959 [Ancylostoma duodenale]|uniref:Uncharacterized protein n=1 Tax=Ancylostoma duodenale TaxID=51022 RepID=A0A0C2C9G4_9BILA|nr:hypothetical protein ANCDUO_16959 [Ancylostoma duodenale]
MFIPEVLDLSFFVPDGVGGVVCLHCSWQGDDRSPNNLRTHLKKFHSSDGVFARFSEKLAQSISIRSTAGLANPRPRSLTGHFSTMRRSPVVLISNGVAEVPVVGPVLHPRPTLSTGRDPAQAIDSRPTRVDIGTLRPEGALSLSVPDAPARQALPRLVSSPRVLHETALSRRGRVSGPSTVDVLSRAGFPRLSVFDGRRRPGSNGAPPLLHPSFRPPPSRLPFCPRCYAIRRF